MLKHIQKRATRKLGTRSLEFLKTLPKNGKVVEVGVQQGDYAWDILRVNNPSELWLVDNWRPWGMGHNELRQRTFYTHVKSRFAPFYNVHILRLNSAAAAATFPDRYFDWVYIDASHDYENVNRDLQTWWPKVKPGGHMAGHDYTPRHKDIVRAVKENFGNNIRFVTNDNHPSFAVQKQGKKVG